MNSAEPGVSPEPSPSREATAEDEVARLSYGNQVFRRLRRNRIALVGLFCIALLFLLATYAPLFAQSQPFYWRSGEQVAFPWFGALFNRLIFESSVDVFFNLLLALSPAYLLVFVSARRRFGKRFIGVRGRLLGGLLAFHFLALLLVAPASWGPLDNPLHYTDTVVDYAGKRQQHTASGGIAIFPPLAFHYRDTNPTKSVQPPSREHWLGTDTEGRDVFTRMLYGTRISLTIGVVAVAIYVAIGIVLGALAGYFGGWVDSLISRLIEVMICFPSFFLILTLAALIDERSIFHVMVIIGLTSWTGVARLIRAEFLKNRNLEYAQAALALGLSHFRVIFRHILPNAIAPVLVTATFGIASAILVESSLAFLGIGDPTVASWGETLNAGRLQWKLWLVLAPGFAIFFVVSVFNLVGEGLRDALDPKLRV